MENKLKELSDILVNYSVHVEKGEKVLINSFSIKAKPLIVELVKSVTKAGAIPFVRIEDQEINRVLLENTTIDRMNEVNRQLEQDNENFDAYIRIRYTENEYESKFVDPQIKKDLGRITMNANEVRVNKRKWVLLNYPSLIDAYKASMPTDEFIRYAFDAMTYDYKKMERDLQPLKELMEKTDKVHIVGPNTDLTFSIKDIPVIPCCGECNIPDGEIYTAPVKDSVNGRITYNTASPYNGNIFRNISLLFKDGKIIEATCDGNNDALNEIFNTDEGARYVGEFSFGVNPLITEPIGDILYDEKISGSIHFTPGKCYDNAYNGNSSSIHWDLVLIQQERFGGGEIYLDDVLVRKDGKFVLDSLKHLN